MLRWLLKEIWQKINVVQIWRDLKALGKKHGRRFFIVALLWEMVEDLLFPYISWRAGAPELIPLFLALHFEPVVYPAFFWGFRTWDRLQGREPWNPDRAAHSYHWRSAVKVLVFQLAITGWLSHFLVLKALIIYTSLTSAFGFVHERIWHDTNFGILADDVVQFRRAAAKLGTYLLVTTCVLVPTLRIIKSPHVWLMFLIIQSITAFLYLVLETVWAKSRWGVTIQG